MQGLDAASAGRTGAAGPPAPSSGTVPPRPPWTEGSACSAAASCAVPARDSGSRCSAKCFEINVGRSGRPSGVEEKSHTRDLNSFESPRSCANGLPPQWRSRVVTIHSNRPQTLDPFSLTQHWLCRPRRGGNFHLTLTRSTACYRSERAEHNRNGRAIVGASNQFIPLCRRKPEPHHLLRSQESLWRYINREWITCSHVRQWRKRPGQLCGRRLVRRSADDGNGQAVVERVWRRFGWTYEPRFTSGASAEAAPTRWTWSGRRGEQNLHVRLCG